MDQPLSFTENLALNAGAILTQYFRLEGIHSELKADRTVVTKADLAADTHIRQTIQTAYPDDLILTEETNQVLLNPDRPLWIIDPLDGTTNFSLGLHTWGVSIARLVSGYPETAALYFPLYQELYFCPTRPGGFSQPSTAEIEPQKEKPIDRFLCMLFPHLAPVRCQSAL